MISPGTSPKKTVGLVKWFDEQKGFGKVGTPDLGDVFFHRDNIEFESEKILKGLPFILEVRTTPKGWSAIKATVPTSYEDFTIILSHLADNPAVEIEVTVSGKSRWGRPYKKTESIKRNLIENSLVHLFTKTKDFVPFFKQAFDDSPWKVDLHVLKRYFYITKFVGERISFDMPGEFKEQFEASKVREDHHSTWRRRLSPITTATLEVSTENDAKAVFLIQQLFLLYLRQTNDSLLFDIWSDNLIYSHKGPLGREVDLFGNALEFEFPASIFLGKIANLYYDHLNRIVRLSNGQNILVGICKTKIDSLSRINKNEIQDVLDCILLINKVETATSLASDLNQKITNVALAVGFDGRSKESHDAFTVILSFRESHFEILESFDRFLSDDARFALWQKTKYFQPSVNFLVSFRDQMNVADFVDTPEEFQWSYFNERHAELNAYEGLVRFCLLSFLIVEFPKACLDKVLPEINYNAHLALWLNFPRADAYWRGKYHQYDYSSNDVPEPPSMFFEHLSNECDLKNTLVAHLLIREIQILYAEKANSHSDRRGFLPLGTASRMRIAEEMIERTASPGIEQADELFKEIFYRCGDDQLNVFIKAVFPRMQTAFSISLQVLINMIENAKVKESVRQDLFAYVSNSASKLERVKMWLNGLLSTIDFGDAVDVFGEFDPTQQPNLLRKIFSLIHRKKDGPIDQVVSRLWTILARPKINFEVGIVLHVLRRLYSAKDYPSEQNLSDLICSYLNENVTQLLGIDDLFEKCRGKTWLVNGNELRRSWYLNILGTEYPVNGEYVDVNLKSYPFDKETRTVNIDGETYPFKWTKRETGIESRLYERPSGVTFCDAVKSQRDERFGKDFYWCCNSRCYSPCQHSHNFLDWYSYSLRDFIQIIGLRFEEDRYYRFVSLLNRANRLLAKLKCTSCNQLLRDAKTSEFAFYRVTTFHCTNSDCDQCGKVIYLTHCLNWKCLNVVDSRVSVGCPNGWYICDACSHCCSQEKLEKRLANLKENGAFQPTNPRHQRLLFQVENRLGHLEKGERFDHKTGEKLTSEL